MCALDIGVRHPHSFANDRQLRRRTAAVHSARRVTPARWRCSGGAARRRRRTTPTATCGSSGTRTCTSCSWWAPRTPDGGTWSTRPCWPGAAACTSCSGSVKGGHTFRVWRTAFGEFLPYAWRSLAPRGRASTPAAGRATAAQRQTVAALRSGRPQIASVPASPVRTRTSRSSGSGPHLAVADLAGPAGFGDHVDDRVDPFGCRRGPRS